MRYAAIGLCLFLASCKSCDDEPTKAGKADAAPEPTKPVVMSDAAPPLDAGIKDAAVTEEIYGEAGTSTCRLAYGPAEQPFRGPAALDANGIELRLIANEGGRPRTFSVPIQSKKITLTPAAIGKPSTYIGVRWPPCEIAGKTVFCPGPSGAITRSTIGETDFKVIDKTKVRNNTRIAAAALDSEHAVVAWLESRQTTEGNMLQAFASLDGAEPVRLSEDGAGATTLRFLVRKSGVVAVYLDTRTNQVPVHARPVALKNNALALGEDVVVAVGGTPERGLDFDVAAVGHGFALIPMPKDAMDFGMATVPIEDPPKLDVSMDWWLYPNGLDPAAIASAPTRDGKAAWIVRARPREHAVGSPHILELGKLDGAGAFTSFGEIALAKNVTDISLVEDTAGSVWILYGDTTVTWLERRICD